MVPGRTRTRPIPIPHPGTRLSTRGSIAAPMPQGEPEFHELRVVFSMKPPAPSVTILGLLQLFATGGGYLLTRAFVRLWDRNSGSALDPSSMTLPRFMAAHGLWLLLLPLVWCSIVVLSARPADPPGSIRQPVLILGVLLTFGLALISSCAVLNAIVSVRSCI